MKKLTLTILALFALTGCEDNNNKTQQQINAEIAERITKFDYEGHKYLLYKRYYNKGGIGGIAHDPDCPCHHNHVKLD